MALHDARRRKTNRKFQRVTRNRRRGKSEMAEVESDDEGECLDLNDQVVLDDMLLKATDIKKA